MTILNPHFSLVRKVCGLSALALAALMSPLQTHAGAFDVGVSPSRFEVSAKSGGRLGQTLEIFNQDGQPTELSVRTLDWEYSEKGELKFFDELRPGSCRPWFTLERKTVRIDARSKASFRFQIDVPADAAVTECRVMSYLPAANSVTVQPSATSSGNASRTRWRRLRMVEPLASDGQT